MKTINYAGFCHCRIAELLDCWEMFTKFKCLGAAAQPAFRESAFIFSPREERQAKEQRERYSEKRTCAKCIFKIKIGCCTLSLSLSVSENSQRDYECGNFLFFFGIFSPGRSNDCLRLIGKRFVLLVLYGGFFWGAFRDKNVGQCKLCQI